jgi:2Fe-2S ferredoxin
VLIKAGESGLTAPDDDELDRLEMVADQQLTSRLGCQAVITRPGDYVVEIPKWNRNYTSEGKPLAMAEGKQPENSGCPGSSL